MAGPRGTRASSPGSPATETTAAAANWGAPIWVSLSGLVLARRGLLESLLVVAPAFWMNAYSRTLPNFLLIWLAARAHPPPLGFSPTPQARGGLCWWAGPCRGRTC